MKGRATAATAAMPPALSDWGEESWTVDCPCGVDFDDGEEMVDCDQCGVWVHTSCCHVLKGHTSYLCDSCKSKNKRESVVETEVAQLLLDLPSKTPPKEGCTGAVLRTRAECTHIQGTPGGDASLFVGVSNVFSRQLWKCTGYIPKALNMSYSDLPPWPKEREGAFSLFSNVEEQQTKDPVATELKNAVFHQAADDVLMKDALPYLEKHGKHEGSRKVVPRRSNNQSRAHALKGNISHGRYSSRRKREAKVISSKKGAVATRAEGTRNKAFHSTKDGSFSFKYTYTSLNKLRTMRRITVQSCKDEDVTTSNECSKVELFSTQDYGRPIGVSVTIDQDYNTPHGKFKNVSTENPTGGCNEEDGLSIRPGTSTFLSASAANSLSYPERKYYDHKEKTTSAVKIGGDDCIIIFESQEQEENLEKQNIPEGAKLSKSQVDENSDQGPDNKKLCQL